MAYTAADLRNDALLHIAVVPAGQAPSAQDAADMDQIISTAQAELVNLGISYWSLDDIPPEIQTPYKEWVGAKAGPSFQVATSPQEETALNKIRRQAATKPHGEPIKSEYF